MYAKHFQLYSAISLSTIVTKMGQDQGDDGISQANSASMSVCSMQSESKHVADSHIMALCKLVLKGVLTSHAIPLLKFMYSLDY